jgi:hypothetical protein
MTNRSENAPIRDRCSEHPDREAIAENERRAAGLCRECWLRLNGRTAWAI